MVPAVAMRSPVAAVEPSPVRLGGRGLLTRTQAVVTVLVALFVGTWIGTNPDAGYFWLTAAWLAWLVGTVWGLTRPDFSLPFAAIQAFMLISLLWPATVAYAAGQGVYIYGVNYSEAAPDALFMVALAQIGTTVGTMLVHIQPTPKRQRLRVELPWRRVDRVALAMVLLGVASLVAFAVVADAALSNFNVFGDANYGDFQTEATGPEVKYFLTLASLAGIGMALAVLRLTGERSRRWGLPVGIIAFSTVFLATGGQRQRFILPLMACALIWWKTAGGRWPRRVRTLAIVGGLVIFTVSAFVNVLRSDYLEYQEEVDSTDVSAVLGDQAGVRSDLFGTTAGLVANVPEPNDFLYGESYVEVAVLPVPRALWKDKPIGRMPELQGNFFDLKIGASFPEFGEMYANFGMPGVAVGSLGLAYLMQYLWVRFVATTDLVATLWFATTIPILLLLFTRNYAAGIIAGQFGILVGTWYCARRFRRWTRHGEVSVSVRA